MARMAIGVDPGKGGGIAVIDEHGKPRLWPMPESDHDLWQLIHGISVEANDGFGSPFAALEKVAAFPGQGVTSMFTFGREFGRVGFALTAAGIAFDLVLPRRWQAALGIPKRDKSESQPDFKRRLRDRARSLYPGVSVTLKTADALLLAEYAWRVRP